MSSETSKPYKSRFFNFLNRQSLDLRERVSRGLRHLKLAAELGISILLYPIYLLVQVARLTERQIGQKIKEFNLLNSGDD